MSKSKSWKDFGNGSEGGKTVNWNPDWPKIRGAMLKWTKEVDEIKCGPEGENFTKLCRKWLEWMSTKVSSFDKILEENGKDWDGYYRPSFEEMRDEMVELYHSNEEFKGNVNEKYVEEQKDKEKDKKEDEDCEDSHSESDGSNSSNGSSSDDVEYTGRYAELKEIGILTDKNEVDKDKLRGAMLKFSEDVDAIEEDNMSPNYEGAKEAFNTYMMDKFGNTWVLFLQYHMDPGQLRSISEAMFERNQRYKNNVEEKWEYKPGNSKEDGESTDDNNKKSNGSDSGPTSLGDFDDNTDGSSDETEEDEGHEKVEEESSGGSYVSENYRLKKFRKVKAGKDEMFELDEIRNTIIRENVWTALDKMPTNSVDTVVTSPPYWNLRDYDGSEYAPIGGSPDCDHSFHKGKCYNCDAWKGQLGREPEPWMFVKNIVSIFEKIGRVLKPTGSVFLNIGDNFAGQDFSGEIECKRKSMMMIPYRIYIKMMELGWVMRQPIVWAKQIQFDDGDVLGATNPTSVKDRINHTFEPMFWFANNPQYYSDIFAVRREPKTDGQDMSNYSGKYDEDEIEDEMYNSPTARAAREGYEPSLYHDAGANIPDVWRVPTGSAGKEHPAVFSPKLPAKPIKMTCPENVCSNCGTPYQREVEEGEHAGWERDCRCTDSGRENGIVFEPFCGRGTTCRAAEAEGRDWITTEVSEKYADFAKDYIYEGNKKLSSFGD